MKTEQGYPVTRTDLNQPIDSVALTLSEFGENLRLVTLETIDSSLFGSALYVVGSRYIVVASEGILLFDKALLIGELNKNMRRITFLLATLLLLGACKEAKKASDRTTSPYQELADQYAEFPLTTDLSKLTEKEKQMLPLLIEAADQMEAIYWQTAYGDKEQLF